MSRAAFIVALNEDKGDAESGSEKSPVRAARRVGSIGFNLPLHYGAIRAVARLESAQVGKFVEGGALGVKLVYGVGFIRNTDRQAAPDHFMFIETEMRLK